jgi:hypothetical protein
MAGDGDGTSRVRRVANELGARNARRASPARLLLVVRRMPLTKSVAPSSRRRRVVITVLLATALTAVVATSIQDALDTRWHFDLLATSLETRALRGRAVEPPAERLVAHCLRTLRDELVLNAAVAGIAFGLLGGLAGWTARRR